MKTTHTPDRDPLEHLAGMPAALMCQLEERLKVRIVEELGPTPDVDLCDIASDLLRRLIRQRLRDGKQFDSILDASRMAFADMMIRNVANKGD